MLEAESKMSFQMARKTRRRSKGHISMEGVTRPSDKEHENSILKSVKFYRDVRRPSSRRYGY
jgi:hypothetical protein